MHFVTREHIHVDRIATAWAIRRFVDPDATFEFVAWTRDPKRIRGIAFDMRGAEIGHRSGRCTFETLIDKYELRDPALRRMSAIIRGADLPQDDGSPPESAGVLAIFDGIRDVASSDEQRLARGTAVCEALYAYCAET